MNLKPIHQRTLTEFLDTPTPTELAHRLELALEGANLGIWDWDLRDNSVHFDRRWAEMLGLKFDDIVQELRTWESRVHPDDLAYCYQEIQKYLRGDTPFYESIHRMKHADGRWVYILDRGRISGWDETGKPLRFTGTHFDITVAEEAKQQVLQERNSLNDIVNNLPHAVALLDSDLRYVAIGGHWLGASPLERDTLLRASYLDTRESVPFFRIGGDWEQAFKRVLAGESLSSERDSYEWLSGEMHTVRWWLRPWGAGRSHGVLIVTEDITSVVEADVRVQQSARLSALGEMAGAIAHEINTPLATISLLGAQISELTSGLQAPLTTSDELAQVRAKAVQLEATASRISRIIQSMKAMSRMSASDPLELTRVSEWVDDTLVLCLEKFRNGGVRVECVTHEQDLKVSCQPAEIGQVLLNLLNNAWDSIRSSPRADGSTSSGWIRLSWGTAPDGKIEFRVEDSGAQIPDSARQKLFQPFFTTKPVGQGTGIGLALSRRIMERHGGTLRLEQAEGKKAFVLEFPGASPQ